ncbi:MAG: SGNH/GDSL hydrolase family protein [Phycisphaeraceae bacterium]
MHGRYRRSKANRASPRSVHCPCCHEPHDVALHSPERFTRETYPRAARMPLQDRERILFIGNSITDTGRNRDVPQPNQPGALGCGYALFTAARLLADHCGRQLEIYNRGVGGDRVTDMAERWQADCIDLQPTLLSVLIGVNDTWHRFGSRGGIELDEYERVYRDLLTQATATLEPLRLVLCEPFALRTGQVTEQWFPEFDQRREIVRKLAGEFDAAFVPFQEMFDRACEEAPAWYWAEDGVHPSLAGHQRMAECWLRTVLG